jgi:ADP-ribose pyrophosphatase
MRPTYHITRSNIVYKSQWMTVYEDWVSKEDDGTIGMFNRIKVHNAVIVVPILADSSLLMVENYRHGAGTNLLELPGGFINENEVGSDAGRRELLEETGYTCNKIEVMNWFYTWPGRTAQRNFVVVARGLKKLHDKNLDEFECIKVHKISADKIRRELKRGVKIKSAVTISALLHGYFLSV